MPHLQLGYTVLMSDEQKYLAEMNIDLARYRDHLLRSAKTSKARAATTSASGQKIEF
jgi:hypothetical protein